MYIRLFLASFCYLWCSLWAQEVFVELSPETCAPGDEVELIFKTRSKKFAQLAVSFDPPDGLHLLAQEANPVEFDSTTREYLHSTRYVFQPMYSGTFEFDGLQVELLSHANPLPAAVLPVRLQVNKVSTDGISSDPEPWPLTTESKDHRPLWFLFLPILVIIGILFFKKRNQKEHFILQEQSSKVDHLTLAIAELKRGHLPVTSLQELLSSPETQLAKATTNSIELALYAEHFESDLLIALLESEVTT